VHHEPVAIEMPVQVPSYAWAWLQRSRPVLGEIARRLTGGSAPREFLDQLRAGYAVDPFTRAVVADVIAEVAFGGRVPVARPRGASWDRGLTWWAAALSGMSTAEFDRPARATDQRTLFDNGASEPRPASDVPPRPPALPGVSRERRALAEALRDLIRASGGEQIPASSIRQLADTLDPS
jgi:hypothetical protein